MTWQDISPAIRTMLNGAASITMDVQIRAIDYECWRCGVDNEIPLLVHPRGHVDQLSLHETLVGSSLEYAADLLALVHHPVVKTVRQRRSKTAGTTYLSMGCTECDSLFGQFPLQEEFVDVVVSDAVSSLKIIFAGTRPLLEWWALDGQRNGEP